LLCAGGALVWRYRLAWVTDSLIKHVNVPHGRAGHPGEPVTFAKTTSNLTHLVMSQRKRAKKPVNEGGIQLTVQAIKRDATLSQQRAAKIYRVPQSTISDRLAGASLQHNYAPNLIKLISTKELVIVQYILKLDKQGYLP
jgi:hypothetical protein